MRKFHGLERFDRVAGLVPVYLPGVIRAKPDGVVDAASLLGSNGREVLSAPFAGRGTSPIIVTASEDSSLGPVVDFRSS